MGDDTDRPGMAAPAQRGSDGSGSAASRLFVRFVPENLHRLLKVGSSGAEGGYMRAPHGTITSPRSARRAKRRLARATDELDRRCDEVAEALAAKNHAEQLLLRAIEHDDVDGPFARELLGMAEHDLRVATNRQVNAAARATRCRRLLARASGPTAANIDGQHSAPALHATLH